MLTDEQAEAVRRRRGDLLLSAGAGSGKTAVLAERFVEAVLSDGIDPQAILAITFTERAAWELRERVRERLSRRGGRRAARDAEAAGIGTFHGFCARVLREDPIAAGLPPGFGVLEEGLAGRLRHAAFTEALRGMLSEGGQREVDLVAAYGVSRLRGIVLGSYAELRSRGIASPSLGRCELGAGVEEEAVLALAAIDALLSRFREAYERHKRRRGAADFDDLELRALELLQSHEDVREHWAQRLDLLMVDEFQDTNGRQLALLGALQRENLFTVGDEWQSIYGFRHAEVAVFRDRAAALAPVGASIALTRSFRCVPAIVDAVNAAFSERFGERYTPLVATRTPEEALGAGVELLLTDRDGWEEDPELAAEVSSGLPDAPRWRQAEARLLARRIAGVLAEGWAQPGEVAVLLRSTKDLPLYERALRDLGVPTLSTVGAFWLDSHVGDVVSYLRALANPYDELSLYGALASPLCGLSADALALLAAAAGERGSGRRLWEALRDGRAAARLDEIDAPLLESFLGRFASQRRRAAHVGIAELIRETIDASGYADWLLRLHGGAQGIANLRKLIGMAADVERSEGRGLRAFLDHVEHLMSGGGPAEPDAPIADDDLDAVSLMSIHAAKGLEFRVVCVADLGRSPNGGSAPDLLLDAQRAGLRHARLDGSYEPTPHFEALCGERDAAEAAEEDRILYVAMTRARDLLLLSGAARLSRWPKPAPGCAPVAWLAPALADDLPRRLQAASSGSTASLGGVDTSARADRVPLQVCTPAGARSQLCLDVPAPEREPVASALDAEPQGGCDASAGTDGEAVAGTGGEAVAGTGGEAVAPGPASTSTRRDAGGPQARRAVRMPDRLSYTALAALERCGYRYYLERVLGLPEEPAARRPEHAARTRGASEGRGPGRGLDARRRGEVVHRLLEIHDFGGRSAPGQGQVDAVASELRVDLKPREASSIATEVAGLLRAPLARRIAAARVIGREHPFAFSVGELEPLIAGAFDLLATEGGRRMLIVDYKSGAVSGEEDLDVVAAAQFGVQRLVYALAALTDGAEEVEVLHWFLHRPLEPVSARYDASMRERLKEELMALLARVRERGYAVSDAPGRHLCLTCPGRRGLCSWDELETGREAVAV